MSFEPGQLVECVDSSPLADGGGQFKFAFLDGLTAGRIYTIRQTGFYTGPFDGEVAYCVWLEEIDRRIWMVERDWPDEPPYLARRFRPLQDSRIAVFRQILARTPRELEQVR